MLFRLTISLATVTRIVAIRPALLATSLFGALLLGISGCAIQPAPLEVLSQQPINTLTPHQQQLNTLRQWRLKGRLAINYNGESWNATIHWQKYPDNYDIQLYLPLGQGSLHLTGNRHGATLETSDGEQLSADSGENLFYQQFGLIFPVTALHDWVIGRPTMEAKADHNWQQQVDTDGQMVSLEQDNWQLRVMGYQNVARAAVTAVPATLSLPGKVFVEQNGNSVRLVVQQWQLDD